MCFLNTPDSAKTTMYSAASSSAFFVQVIVVFMYHHQSGAEGLAFRLVSNSRELVFAVIVAFYVSFF